MEKKKKIEKMERKDHFSIRKLTIGATSVLLGGLSLGLPNTLAKADTNTNSNNNSGDQNVDVLSDPTQETPTSKANKEAAEIDQRAAAAAARVNSATSDVENQASVVSENDTKENNVETQTAEKVATNVEDHSTENSATEHQTETSTSNSTTSEENKPSEDQAALETEAEKKTNDQNKVAPAVQDQNKSEAAKDDQQEYNISITNIDDVTGETLYGTGTYKVKAGDKQKIYTGYVGYKLMNPEALEGYQFTSPGFGNAYLTAPDHDVNLTLHFAPLAPTVVEYVDTDGNLLTKFSDSSKASTSKSPFSDQDGINDSKFLARAIDIPGYELVSEPEIEKPITQVSSKDNVNAMVLKFVYKKIAEHAEDGLPQGGGITGTGEDYGISWSKLPGGVNIDLVKDNYGQNSYEETIKKMEDRYTKQGFSYIGVLNNHDDSDPTNRLELYISVHFLQHKNVTVNYVDQNGNKLADSVIISFNKDNPDQTNNGINPKQNWYPNGEWKSEQKSFDGYTLKTVKGATEGKFTTFAYNVTYVYTNEAAGKVTYIDDNTNQVLTTDDLTGTIDSTIDYSTADKIAGYEKQGYKLVSDNYSGATHIFNQDSTKNNFEVHLAHDILTSTVTKNGSQIVHYVFTDGTTAHDDSVQSTEFVQTIKTDAVTKQVISQEWNKENHTFDNVTSPTITGYHPDKKVVDGATVTVDNPISETTVIYAQNEHELRNQQELPASQLVKYVDEDGNELHPSASQSFTFTYTGDTYDKETGELISKGTWNVTSHGFTSEGVPVINGYYAISGFDYKDGKYTAGGFTAENTGTKKELNRTLTVVYRKLGKIVPVDSSGKPIPNVPTPSYTNDPTDPTKVTPNEPVPDIPGMTPQTPSVTPTDPGKDTPVPYTPTPDKPDIPTPQPTAPQPTNPTTPDTPAPTPNPQDVPSEPDETPDTPTPDDTVTSHATDDKTPDEPATVTPHATTNRDGDVTPHAAVDKKTPAADKTIATSEDKRATLPQTGEDDNEVLTAAGLALTNVIALALLAGADKKRRKKN